MTMSTVNKSLPKFSALNIPMALVIAVAFSIMLSVCFNLLFTLTPWAGNSIHHLLGSGLNGMVISPAIYALAIWGIIYLGLFAMVAYQFGVGCHPRANHERWHEPEFQSINRYLIGISIGQILWSHFFAAQQLNLAIVAMAVVLLLLIVIYRVLHDRIVWASSRRLWLCHAPISLYLSWASILMVLTIATTLHRAGWQSAGIIWGTTVLCVLTLLSGLFILTYRDILFALGLVWGLVMVAIQQRDVAMIDSVALFLAFSLILWSIWIKNPRFPRRLYYYY